MAEMFYKAVVQTVLLFDLESLVLSTELGKTVEGIHTYFLRQTTGKRCGGGRTECGLHRRRRKCRKQRELSQQQLTLGIDMGWWHSG